MLICEKLLLLDNPPKYGDLFEVACCHHPALSAMPMQWGAALVGYDRVPVLPVVLVSGFCVFGLRTWQIVKLHAE